MTSAATNRAAMTTSIPVRTTPRSARTRLPSQAYAAHDHQSSRNRISPRARDRTDGECAMNETTRVIANTKTRSKKISKEVARWDSGVIAGRRHGRSATATGYRYGNRVAAGQRGLPETGYHLTNRERRNDPWPGHG
jgi:hypothetical protein